MARAKKKPNNDHGKTKRSTPKSAKSGRAPSVGARKAKTPATSSVVPGARGRRLKKGLKVGKSKSSAKVTTPTSTDSPNEDRDPSIISASMSLERRPRPGFPIVGIGASAGGLTALGAFLENTPSHTGMAFVIVEHLDPNHVSVLHELLRRHTPMPVNQIQDGTAVEPDHVYVVPPGRHLAIMNGVLHLMQPDETSHRRLPIDYFFRSLAEDQREYAVGVILSGTGSDGTVGIRAIKGEAGFVVAQSPDSAKFPGMPASAVASGLVDLVLPTEEIPAKLLGLSTGPTRQDVTTDSDTELHPTVLQKIFLLLRSRTGHDFSLYKPMTIRRRIARRMNVHQIDNPRHYVRYLETNPQELDLLFKDLLIGVTGFFRDPEAFEALALTALPEILKAKTDDTPLRVWVPACSTGEEAFSIAILIRERMEKIRFQREVQIFATDLDPSAIEVARASQYPDGVAGDIGQRRLHRYFTREDGHYRVKKEIREMVVFAVQNLLKDPPFTRLDLISCRNLLIYLQPEMQKQLIPLFHYAIRPGGVLFLGTSASISGFSQLFKPIERKWKIYRRTEGPAALTAMSPTLLVAPSSDKDGNRELDAGRLRHVLPTITESSNKALAERFAPPSVIVNERGDIVYFHGATGGFLEPAPGMPSYNVHSMAREGLQLELTTMIRKAAGQDGEIIRRCVDIKSSDGYVSVDLRVRKISFPEALRGLIMITFEAEQSVKPARSGARKGTKRRHVKGREADLERELQFVRNNLESTIEELQTSNEEQKSSNEELQSTNEELQSANEELETSKEEMQSLNEELQTVNAELQAKVDVLSQTNDDMTNLLNATEIATIFLDNELRIKRFTTQATGLFRLIPTDVGRPITDIVSRLNYEHLERDARQVLATLSFHETNVQSDTGQWFALRILPYRTAQNVIDGLVTTFVNIDNLKKAELESRKASLELTDSRHALRTAEELAEYVMETMREPVVVLDQDSRVVSANASFYQHFQISSQHAIGRAIFSLNENQWDIPDLRRLLEVDLRSSGLVRDFRIEHEFRGAGRRVLKVNARRLAHNSSPSTLVLLVMEDITECD